MDFSQLLSFQVLFQAVFIGIVVYVFKVFIENELPKLNTNKKYKNVFIPFLAITLGIGIAMIGKISPTWLNSGGYTDRVMYGVILGFSSSFIFRTFKNILIRESGGENDT